MFHKDFTLKVFCVLAYSCNSVVRVSFQATVVGHQHAAEHWDVGVTKHVHDQAEGTQHTAGLDGVVGLVAEQAEKTQHTNGLEGGVGHIAEGL